MRRLNSKGQSAIEFAFVLPILFIFFFALIEFGLLYIQDLRVSALSREVSNAAFRDCGGLTGNSLDNCLGLVVNDVQSAAGNFLPNFSSRGTLIASVYAPDVSALGNPKPVLRLGLRSTGGGGASSLYSASDLDAQLVSAQSVVVIGEAFYDFETLTPLQSLLTAIRFPAILFPEVLYESTIY